VNGILIRMIIIVLFRFPLSSDLIPFTVGCHTECYFLLVYSDLDFLSKKSRVTYIHCSMYMIAYPFL